MNAVLSEPIALHMEHRHVMRRLEKDFQWALHQARVYREAAHKEPATRRFWFESAHDAIHKARIIKARMRVELR